MKTVMRAGIAILLALTAAPVTATTCSCANVPLLGTMELATPGIGQWFLATSYEFHDASELVSGSSTVPDQTGRERTSQAFVVELSRAFGEKFSFSALVAGVNHKRTVGGIRDDVAGLGDGIVMLKYSPASISLYSRNALSFGIGARLPIGEDSASRDGIVLAEDLQPSTGAFAGTFWVYAARALNESRGARVYATATYSYNGENDRDYQFGHSATASLGGSYQTQSPWGFNLEALYRHAERDQRAGVDIPNTGGQWLDLVPAVQYHINESVAFRVSGKIPLWRDLNDQLQFTTKYSVRLTLSWLFGN
jgi:hypothetical protein